MENQKKCLQCDKQFEVEHGNNRYCSPACSEKSRKIRQKKKRDPIKKFIAILIRNHEIVHELFLRGIKELSAADLDAYGIDISLCRYMHPPLEHAGSLKLDFGYYYFVTDTRYKTFKILKHENGKTNESK